MVMGRFPWWSIGDDDVSQTVQLFKRQDGLWDWRLINDGNHEVEATSGGQGYTERNDAAESIARVFGSRYPIQVELPLDGVDYGE